MAPIRRYLRITKFSVLEVRIHLESPSQISWLLQGKNAALPRIMEAIRPIVLPKLREQNERARTHTASTNSTSKKRVMKDVAGGDDFEVSIFFGESPARHAIMTKSKTFLEASDASSNNSESSVQNIITIDDDTLTHIRQESPDETNLYEIPEAEPEQSGIPIATSNDNDDKKLIPRTSYDGFSIYGQYLCLFIKRKQGTAQASRGAAEGNSSQQIMENWISTQVAAQAGLDNEEEFDVTE